MKTNAKKLMYAAAVAVAIALGACVAQPAQQCQVSQGVTAIIGLPQFWVQYKPAAGSTGACSMLGGEEVGFQTYTNPADVKDLKVAIRTFGLGGRYSGDIDPVPRVDPADPDGKKINSVVKMTPFPDADYVCKNDGDIPEAVQNFQEEMIEEEMDLPDGGTEIVVTVIPAVTVKYKWSEAEWMSSPSVPGQAFHAKMQYTEGTCTATFDATGIYPQTGCVKDLDCSPIPLPNATDMEISDPTRRLIGSGLNPEMTVKCDDNFGVCVMSIPWAEFKAQQGAKAPK